jgi:enamine deaminase RidA (YjgF/YER057c/UK114 family)
MTIERIKVGPRMSQAVIHDDTVYLAGQVADDPSADVADQTRQILAKIDRLLAEASTDKSKLLSANVWLSDISTFDQMNAVWDKWVTPDKLWHRLLRRSASESGSRGWGPRTGRPLPEAMVLKETRSNSQIPTPFPHRFPLNSHALTSVEGLLGQDEIDAAIQTTSTSKARRVDFGGCGPSQCL